MKELIGIARYIAALMFLVVSQLFSWLTAVLVFVTKMTLKISMAFHGVGVWVAEGEEARKEATKNFNL